MYQVLSLKFLNSEFENGQKPIYIFGLIAHLLAAFFSIGAHHPDELFQVFEFAGYKLGLNTAAELPWEFHEKMRSGLQPLLVFLITKGLHALSVQNPFSIALIIRVLQVLFSFFITICFVELLEKEFTSQKFKNWLWGFGLLFWCLPFFHARFSSENFSITLFLAGLILILKSKNQDLNYACLLLEGLLFGLSFISRFQMIFCIAGFMLWLLFIQKINFKVLTIVFLGIFLSLGLGVFIDRWLYGEYTISWWNYLDLNLFKDKASAYGREPLYYYFEQTFLQLIPPFSIIIIFSVIAFWIKFKTHMITWITLPFILLHFVVAHKELRFLFPVLNFLPFMLLYYFQSLESSDNKFVLFLKSKGFVAFAVSVNMLILVYYTFKPADSSTQGLKKIYELVEGPKPVLYYEEKNPYNDLASLNYFRKSDIKTIDLYSDTLSIKYDNSYYYSETFEQANTVVKNKKVFVKLYSNFPDWFKHINFNGWLERAGRYSIYKGVDPVNK